MRSKSRIFFVAVMLIFILTCFCGCQSVYFKDAELNHSEFENASFEYNEHTGKTKISFNAAITNNAIYDIDEVVIALELYENPESHERETYRFDIDINASETFKGTLDVKADGNIKSIEYVSWDPEYKTFFETYMWVLIVASSIALIAVALYIVNMIREDMDFDDFKEVLSCNIVLIIILAVVGASINIFSELWSLFTMNWVSVLILFVANLVFILLCLIAQSVKALFNLIL